MELERKAMYNLLRMNWLQDPSTPVEPWQVEDYRNKPLNSLFKDLEKLGISLEASGLLAYAENYETPEDLALCLVPEGSDAQAEDHAYLLIFELWRRLVPEKPSLSIFCDELDHQIYLHDEGKLDNPDGPQDSLASLATILEENVDSGADPEAIFQSIEIHCGNDLESFLYDFIAEQIDEELFDYASELINIFYPFVSGKKWFDFLRARIIAPIDMKKANALVKELIDDDPEENNIEFTLEVLQFLAHWGDHSFFLQLALKTTSLIETEDELQDLLIICSDYYQCLDHDKEDELIQEILSKRAHIPIETQVTPTDPDIDSLRKILERYLST